MENWRCDDKNEATFKTTYMNEKKDVCEQWNFFGTYVKAVRFTHDTRSFFAILLAKANCLYTI